MTMKSYLLGLFYIIIALTSCSGDYPKAEQKLVIEGWIENGEFPIVIVSLSGNIDNDGDKIADFVAKWAKVTISDGDSTYILMGKPDKKYLPPYVYTSYDFRGEVGKTYALEVEYNDMKAMAVTSIPEPIEIDSIEINKVAGNDTLYSVNVVLSPEMTNKEYFRLRYRDYSTENRFYPSFLGTFYIAPGSSSSLSIPLYKAKRKTIDDYVPYFSNGSDIEIRLGHISEESYNIWCDYDNIVNFGSNVFFKQQIDLHSNIKGGYGYWIGYGISKYRATLY